MNNLATTMMILRDGALLDFLSRMVICLHFHKNMKITTSMIHSLINHPHVLSCLFDPLLKSVLINATNLSKNKNTESKNKEIIPQSQNSQHPLFFFLNGLPFIQNYDAILLSLVRFALFHFIETATLFVRNKTNKLIKNKLINKIKK